MGEVWKARDTRLDRDALGTKKPRPVRGQGSIVARMPTVNRAGDLVDLAEAANEAATKIRDLSNTQARGR
jgi:hypothetical protein